MIRKPGEKSVSEHVTGVVKLAFVPVRFAAHTAGSVVSWAGNQLEKLSRKL
jgi:hypothetical protein